MCFSAEASFGASAVISMVGLVAYRKSVTLPQKVFALIPLFFALQQFIEGFLWVVLRNGAYVSWKYPLTIGFLIFAWLVWPLFIPLSMYLQEKNKTRKKILLVFQAIGIFMAGGFIYVMLFHNVDASIAKYHVNYTYDFKPPFAWFFGLLYLIPTVVSMMVSSVKRMWVLGIINICSYMFSRIFFFGQVISVWCFFGAIASITVLWIVMESRKTVDASNRILSNDQDDDLIDRNIQGI